MHRETFGIILNILKTLEKGATKPTVIMYSTRLSWGPMLAYMDKLIQLGFITKEELEVPTKSMRKPRHRLSDKPVMNTKKQVRYHITREGLDALHQAEEIARLFELQVELGLV